MHKSILVKYLLNLHKFLHLVKNEKHLPPSLHYQNHRNRQKKNTSTWKQIHTVSAHNQSVKDLIINLIIRTRKFFSFIYSY